MNNWKSLGFSFKRSQFIKASVQVVLVFAVLISLVASAVSVNPARAANYFVSDSFSAVQYNNQNGSANWSTNWTETNDDGAAGTGNVQITGGELLVSSRFVNNDVDFEAIQRSVNLSTSASNSLVLLSYSFRSAQLEANDTLFVEIYNGTTWPILETISGDNATGIRNWDITAYKSANTIIRFRITGGFDQTNEIVYFDNVEISYVTANTHTSNSVLQTVQTYYLPIPEDQVLQALVAIENGGPSANKPVSPTFVYVSVTIVADSTVIYYDHWEDGFETAVNDPVQNTTEVWGDNDPANGMPPGFTSDILSAGNIVILTNPVNTSNLGLIDFDGGDKLASTEAIAVTRTSWASGSGTLHGGSVEVLDTSVWGKRYYVPVGPTVTGTTNFEYTAAAIMASQDNTTVNVTGYAPFTLNEGQSRLVIVGINNTIITDKDVQVALLTGDIASNFSSSFFTLYPFELLSNNYYAPVPSNVRPGPVNVPTDVLLHNPNTSAITVQWQTIAGLQTPINIAAGSWGRATMPYTATGARFYTTGAIPPVFQAISLIDAQGQTNDWGYTLIPSNQLTQQAKVGWGVGRDPTSTTLPNENGSRVWVTAVGSGTMNVCADYNGDAVGSLTDINGRKYDQLLQLTNLQQAKVADTDGDQTGMLLYLCNGSEAGNVNKIAVAWGQDPASASTGAPGLDIGTTVPPLPNFTAVKDAELVTDINGDGKFDVGETFEYKIEIKNTGALPVSGGTITVSDIVPQYTLYVPNSTSIYYTGTGSPTAIPDGSVPPASTAFPLDEGGYLIPQTLGIEQNFVVTFAVRIDASLPGATRIQNSAQVSGLNLLYDPQVEIVVQPPDENSRIGDTIWLDLNGDGVQDAGEPGLPGITLELRDGTCVPNSTCLTDVTDANGIYGFPNLINNTYTVVVKSATLPAGISQTGDPDQPGVPCTTCDGQHTLTLTNLNKPYLAADFGYQGNASISNFVWNDLNGNGLQDAGEGGIGGVTVWIDLDNDGVQDATEPYDVTDANGIYYIGSLPAGTYTVRTAGAPITGATPTYDLNGVGTPNVTSVTLTTGQNRIDVDWGYQFAALSITKTSDAGGTTSPGDIIEYTVTMRNNTASQQTVIAITDAVPTGTTYVTGSVTGYKQYEYRDNFNTGGGYSQTAGLSDWSVGGATPWTETGDDNSPTAGTIQILANELRLQNANGDFIQRTIPGNLTGQTVTLEIDYRELGTLEAADGFYVEMWNGTGWTAVITRLNDFGNPAAETVDISLYASANTQIRIRSTYNASDEIAFVDYVRIYYTANVVDVAIHTPPNIIVAGDNFSLNPGQSMTVTYRVRVNNPVNPPGLSSIDNTARVTSYQQGTPHQASVSDDIEVYSLTLVKNVTEKYFNAAGQILNYGFLVTNSGDAPLLGPVTIADNKSTNESCPAVNTVGDLDAYLDPGESLTCTATYTVAAGDVTAGSVTNIASATADGVTSNTDTRTVPRRDSNFGHLPSSYTNMNLYNDGGARHLTGTTYLGVQVPIELDGINDPTFTRDTTYDDGVAWSPSVNWKAGTVASGNGGSVDVTVKCPSAPCYLNAWIDWNNDGDFLDLGEQIFLNRSVNDGSVSLTFDIPGVSGTPLNGSFYARFRLYNENPGPTPPPNRQALNAAGTSATYGEVEEYKWDIRDGVVTPVTLSYFIAQQQGSSVNFTWSTATETGNIGFNLYVEQENQRTRINVELIPSAVIDSLNRQDYSFIATTVEGDIFYIEDIDILGQARLHGPFMLGEAYGGLVDADRIDWFSIQAESSRYPVANQGMKVPVRVLEGDPGESVEEPSVVVVEEEMPLDAPEMEEVPPSDKLETQPAESLLGIEVASVGQQLANTINLEVRQTGMYRVTYEMLKAAGLDLKGVPLNKIMLTNRGQVVPIFVKGLGKFGPGAYIEFYGQALDTLYTDTNIYTVQVSSTPIGQISVSNNRLARAAKPLLSYTETLVVNNQRAYANYAPGTDAWYDTEMLVFKTGKSWDFPFQVNGLANPSAASTIELVVWGVTDWPQNPDHHLVVSLNGVVVAAQTFDGLTEQNLNIILPAGTLQEGANTLRLTLPGDTGVDWDLINLDKFSVTYQRVFQAVDGRLAFIAAGQAFKVTNLPSKDVVVYQMTQKGPVRLAQVLVQASGNTYSATFAGTNQPLKYLVTTVEALYTPMMQPTRLQADLNHPAQYLIIAHPNFISGLGPLVQARLAQGLTVSVVDVNDLYTQYTYGVFDPSAIQQYIAYAAQNLGTQYVLLVGGDTYDYRNYLGVNSLSFIPSLYATTGAMVKFVPSDPLYADVNEDNIPDLAIGRFPVRTTAELDQIINKTLAYAGKDYGRTAVFASDKTDGSFSFKDISNSLAAGLPGAWSVENIHLDAVSVSTARTQLIAAMNRGTALVTFTGHSAPTMWTFSGLFKTQNAAALLNAGRPFVAVQWGCWNNYYVDPVNNSLVQSLLFSGDRGAVALLGASTLTDSASEELLGELLTPILVTPGMSIGQALQAAKLELAQTHPELLDVLLGWSLLGDPALVIEP